MWCRLPRRRFIDGVGGEFSAPPEDVGGVSRYEQFPRRFPIRPTKHEDMKTSEGRDHWPETIRRPYSHSSTANQPCRASRHLLQFFASGWFLACHLQQ
jgi:hypothetical protein